jgi:hypothetical protein
MLHVNATVPASTEMNLYCNALYQKCTDVVPLYLSTTVPLYRCTTVPGIRGVDLGVDAAGPVQAVWLRMQLLRRGQLLGIAEGGGRHPVLVGGEGGRVHQYRTRRLLHVVAHHARLAVRELIHACGT